MISLGSQPARRIDRSISIAFSHRLPLPHAEIAAEYAITSGLSPSCCISSRSCSARSHSVSTRATNSDGGADAAAIAEAVAVTEEARAAEPEKVEAPTVADVGRDAARCDGVAAAYERARGAANGGVA